MPFFLFIVFVVYTLLPFSMHGAVVVGVISSISHLLVLGALMGGFSTPSVPMGLQVRGAWESWHGGGLRGCGQELWCGPEGSHGWHE